MSLDGIEQRAADIVSRLSDDENFTSQRAQAMIQGLKLVLAVHQERKGRHLDELRDWADEQMRGGDDG